MITITNNNIFRSDFSISDYENYESIEIIDDGDILSFLTELVELGESVTFKRIFEIISANSDLFNIVFYSSLGGYPIEPYLHEIENIPTNKTEIKFLELYWSCDKYEGELSITPCIHGVGAGDNNDIIAYAIDFTSLNDLQNLNLRLNDELVISEFKENKTEGEDRLIINNMGKMKYTLFDLFNAILSEISFHGGPNDKIEAFKNLEKDVESAQQEFDTGILDSGKTLENMLDEWELKDIYLVKIGRAHV